jgi:hypothetical protein
MQKNSSVFKLVSKFPHMVTMRRVFLSYASNRLGMLLRYEGGVYKHGMFANPAS